jgi:type IV pilus assembly protein PilP
MRLLLVILNFFWLCLVSATAYSAAVSFQAFHARDPFVLGSANTVMGTRTVDKPLYLSHVKQPLEQYPLSTLQYVGLMESDGQCWGLVRATDGQVYAVQVEGYIGQQQGQVINITQRALTLNEWLELPDHTWVQQEVALGLAEVN